MITYSDALEFFVENGISLDREQMQNLQESLFKSSETETLIKNIENCLKSFLKAYKVKNIAIKPTNKKSINNNMVIFQFDESGYSKFAKANNDFVGSYYGAVYTAGYVNDRADSATDKSINKAVSILQDPDAVDELNQKLSEISDEYKIRLKSASKEFVKISVVKNK